MARSNRRRRAENKIDGSTDEALNRIDDGPVNDAPAVVSEAPGQIQRVRAVSRSSIFAADFEEVVEIIARDRVYRAMLAGLGRRFLPGPAPQIAAAPLRLPAPDQEA